MSRPTQASPHHVVVIGAGFGGLETVRHLAGAPVRITLIDGRNHHLFQPLLYQVATASLAPSEIAWPIRHLLRRRRDVTTWLAAVEAIDKDARHVRLDDGSLIDFDTLVLATGARHAYFGHDDWEPFAPGLKTLEDATGVRSRILLAFERAERETDERKRAALMTFVIVGAGPTGVELAGTIAELARTTFPADFRNIDTRQAWIVLIEAGPRALPAFRQELSDYAKRSLQALGVEVELEQAVTECSGEGVVYGGKTLAAATVIWAAGVQASPAAQWLDAPADRAGRLKVEPDLAVPGRPEIFAIGDAALVLRPDGRPVPGIAPAAKQEGSYVAKVIRARLTGEAAPGFQLQARRRPGDDRQAARRDRFRRDPAARDARLVALGLRPHLFPDRRPQPAQRRAQLAMDLRARPAQRPAHHMAGRRGGSGSVLARRETLREPGVGVS
jgi:NADH:ubiquinone reductase (H+-translocating)